MIDPKRVLRALAEHWTLLEPLCERFDTGTLSLVELRNQLSTQLPEGSPADITAHRPDCKSDGGCNSHGVQQIGGPDRQVVIVATTLHA